MTRALLFGSESLTDEEECYRAELLDWVVKKAVAGGRPIPIQAAFMAMSDFCSGNDAEGQKFWRSVAKTRKGNRNE